MLHSPHLLRQLLIMVAPRLDQHILLSRSINKVLANLIQAGME